MRRIGLLYPHDTPLSPANWSGTPAGLREGFATQGIDVAAIPCRLAEPVRIGVAMLARARGARGLAAHREPVYTLARGLAIARALARAEDLDAVVAMGTDLYDLALAIRRFTGRVATYDDGNFRLFRRYKDSEVGRSETLPGSTVETWARRQAAACRAADIACVSTAWAGRSLVDDFGIPPAKVCVVGMGHRPPQIDPTLRDWSVPRFLFVGVDWRRKNGDAVVRAFARVRESYPQAVLDLVGEHPPISEPGVIGHGLLSRDDPAAQRLRDRLFSSATAFVVPSLFDPSPIAYLEAASAGLPVIATTCGGAGELLGKAAISVDPYDNEALAMAMRSLAAPETARALGAEALTRSAGATWSAVAARIADRLAALGGGAPSGARAHRSPLSDGG